MSSTFWIFLIAQHEERPLYHVHIVTSRFTIALCTLLKNCCKLLLGGTNYPLSWRDLLLEFRFLHRNFRGTEKLNHAQSTFMFH